MNPLELFGVFGIVIYALVGIALFIWLRNDAAIRVSWTWYVAAAMTCLIWGAVVFGVLIAHLIRFIWMIVVTWRA